MIKLFLVITLLWSGAAFSAMSSFSDLDVDTHVHSAEAKTFTSLAAGLGENANINWTQNHQFSTFELYEAFQAVTDIDETPHLEDQMKSAAMNFAEVMLVWTKVMASDIHGDAQYRLRTHRNFCSKMLFTLAVRLPFHSQKVKEKFFSEFYSRIQADQVSRYSRLSELEHQTIEKKKKINFAEGATSVTFAMVAASAIHHMSGNLMTADAGGLLSFALSLYTLKMHWVPKEPAAILNNQMVYSLNDRILCEKFLENKNDEKPITN